MNQNINVDLIPKFAVYGNLYFSQYDVGREAIINLVNGSTEYEIPSGATVTLVATKPSGLGFTQNCTFEGNQITVVCTAEMTDEAGSFPCEIRIANGSLLLGTANFTFNVERSPHPEGTTDGTAESVVSEITVALQNALTDLQTESAAQQDAIQAKGETTIASIPSDYTELSGEVANLKSALFNDEGTNLITSSTIRNSAGSGSNYITIDKTKLTMLWHLQISLTTDTSAITLSSNLLNLNTDKEYVFFAHLKSLSDHNVSQGAIGVQYLVDGQTPQSVTSAYALPFAQVMDGYVRGVFKPNRTTGYIRFVFNGMASGAKVVNLMVDQLYFGEMPVGYAPSKVYGAVRNSNNPVDKLYMTKDADYFNADLLCWGDSLTAGAGGNGTTYPDVCASELGLSVLNCGVGGENCNTISARQGGNNVVIPAGPVNGTYAHLYDIFGYELAPLLQGDGNNSGREIIVNGLNCQLVRSSGNYVISGYSGDALTVPILARFNGSDFKGKIVTIWIGTNGGSFPGTSAGIDMRIAWINSMIKHIGHEHYVILGLTVGEETASFYINEENRMKQAFGSKYFPTRKYLIESGLTIAGITPTSQDETDIAAGKVPTSLKSDSIHLNASGYTAVGKLLANKIRSLGYV